MALTIQGKRVERSQKVAFMKVGETGTFNRMQGFTAFPPAKNATTYERTYVDEKGPRTDTVGMSESIEYTFDYYKGNPVHDAIVEITDKEKIGDEAIVEIMIVDLMDLASTTFPAKKRAYSVTPGTEGDGTDTYAYGGTFTSNGEVEIGTATTTDDWMTATFVPESSGETGA